MTLGAFLLSLIGFVDVSSLLLVRAESRRREIAVRGALGATRTRLVRQFAVEGFLLAGAGVISYSVGQRTREIGVRMALGAQRPAVYQLILKEACWLTVLGIGGGILGSAATASLGRSMLFGVSPWDLGTMLAVVCVLAAAALLASYLPARRAASINPNEALRAE